MNIKNIEYDFCMGGYYVTIFIGDRDLIDTGGKMEYYELDKEKRWLGDNSPSNIGGRSTDISQIGFSLKRIVKELYPINEVPDRILDSLNTLQDICEKGEKQIEDTISLISDYYDKNH